MTHRYAWPVHSEARAILTALFAVAAALAVGAISVTGSAPFAVTGRPFLIWTAEMALVLSAATIAIRTVSGGAEQVSPALVSVFSAVLVLVFCLHAPVFAGVPLLAALLFAGIVSVIFLILPQLPAAVPWLAVWAGLAFSSALIIWPGSDGVRNFAAWAGVMIVLVIAARARWLWSLGHGAEAGESRTGSIPMNAVVHDMGTPINAITGLASLLARDERVAADPDLARTVAHIQGAGQRLERLAADLVTLEQFRLGVLEIRSEPFDLARLAAQVVEEHAGIAERHGVGLKLTCAGPVEMESDPAKLRQVLANLLGSAIRHSETGRDVHLRVSAAGAMVSLAITGHAAPDGPDKRRQLFRLHDRKDRADLAGAGVGLMLVQSLANAMAGRLKVTDRPGGETTLTAEFPVAAGRRVRTAPRGDVLSSASAV